MYEEILKGVQDEDKRLEIRFLSIAIIATIS